VNAYLKRGRLFTMLPSALYQVEVKLGLATFPFQASAGWRLTMHIDPMERGVGGRHPAGKAKRANAALRELRRLGVTIGTHKLYGPVDVVAEHATEPTRLIEVEGESGRQREQALYSSLGQLLLSMKIWSESMAYGIAVPDTREWWQQLRKIPLELTKRLRLWRYSVGVNSCTSIAPGMGIPDWSRG
jgi:hypothetical protein